MVRPARKVRIGNKLMFTSKIYCDVIDNTISGGRVIRFEHGNSSIYDVIEKIDIKMPLVIRLAGTNVEKGNKILKDSKINYIEANTLEDAANKAVKALEN